MSKQFYEINDIPNHWEVSRLKYVFEFSNETSTEYELQKNLALTKKGIIEKNIELNEGQIARDYKKYIFIKENQICLNPMDLLSGWVDISPINGLISPAYYTLIPKENFDVKFLNYFLQSNYYRKTFFSIVSVNAITSWAVIKEASISICVNSGCLSALRSSSR